MHGNPVFGSRSESKGHIVKPQFSRLQWTLALIFLTTIVLRLLVFAYIAHEPRKHYFYDSDGYHRRALNLLHYGVFASEAKPPLTPDLDRTPVYPAILATLFAAFGDVPQPMILLQILLSGLTAILTYYISRELALPTTVGIIAAFFVAIDPVSVLTANHLLTETLFTTLLVLSIWLLIRFWRTRQIFLLLLAALFLSLTALTRPISQFLPLALLPLFALTVKQTRMRAVLTSGILFVVVSMALTYTWAVRNYRETGIFTLSTISDTNLIYYRARAVLAGANGEGQETTWRKLEADIDRQVAEQNLTPTERIALQRRQALAIFLEHPGLTASMTVKGAARILFDPGYTISCTLLNPDTTSFECLPGKASMNEPGLWAQATGKLLDMSLIQQFTLLVSTLLLAVMYMGAAAGSVRLLRQRQWLPILLLAILVAYFVGLSAGAEGNSRFRIPAMPFFAILAGLGLQGWMLSYREKQAERRHQRLTTIASEQG